MGESGDAFAVFFADAEPRLRIAFVASLGPERGLEAASEALTYAWQHWDEIREMTNPIGYLYRVGQSRSRVRQEPVSFPPVPSDQSAWVEPALPRALENLSDRERQAVVLIEGFGWTFREVAECIDVSVSSVQSYVERAMAKLRHSLGVDADA